MAVTLKEIERIADKFGAGSNLVGFLGKSEKEAIVEQTIFACIMNHAKFGKCFAFNGVRIETRLAQNVSSLQSLVEDGLLEMSKHDGNDILIPTQKLIDRLNKHLEI